MYLASLLLLALAAAPAEAGSLPDILEPLRTGARAPADAAVVIGVERYPFVSDVPYAQRDAQAVYNFLVYTRGVPADRVRLLDRGANREQILEAVAAAGQSVGRDGVVWVYFAGHGAADGSTGERLLLGDDVRQDAAAFTSRGVPVSKVQKKAAAGGGSVFMLVDACYAGVGRAGEELLAGMRFLVPSYATAATPRTLEWNAAGPDQLSGPIEAVQHGAFTYLAVGALRGWADGQVDGRRDGQVTAEEAVLFVNQSLRALQITEQQSQLVATDPSRLVLVQADGLEEAPVLDARVALTPAPGEAPARPSAPTGPLDVSDRAGVTAWLQQLVETCYDQHADGDASLRQWHVRFRVRPGPRTGPVTVAPMGDAQGEFSASAHAMHTCIRGELRHRDMKNPSRAVVYTNQFTVPADRVAQPAPAEAPATTAAAPADPTHEVRVELPGMSASVRLPGIEVTETDPASRAAPPPAVPDEVQLVLRNPNGDWTDVRVNGAVVAEFRNQRELTVSVRPGTHTIEFVPFMGDTPFASGRLVTGEADEIIFGIDASSSQVTCYNHDGWQLR